MAAPGRPLCYIVAMHLHPHCSTGAGRLRAGLPAHYRVGDKTGTGENGATNDVAIAWPPNKSPLLIAAYTHGSSASGEARSDALAQAARAVVSAWGSG